MAMTAEPRSLTIRLQPDLYEAATQIARKRGRSLNALVQQGLEAIVRVEEEKEMYEAATILGMDSAECDVNYAFAAQAEVILKDER